MNAYSFEKLSFYSMMNKSRQEISAFICNDTCHPYNNYVKYSIMKILCIQ